MTAVRVLLGGAALAATALFLVVGAALTPTDGDLALRSGCTGAVGHVLMRGDQVVMDLRAEECIDDTGRPRSSSASVDALARTAWSELRTPVDGFVVTVDRTVDGVVTSTASREVLRQRFGPGPPGPVLPVAAHRPADLIWLVLPLGYLTTCAVLIMASRRCGFLVVWIRR